MTMKIVLIAPAIPDYCVEYANTVARTTQVTLLAAARAFAGYSQFVDERVNFKLLDWPRHRSPRNFDFALRLTRSIHAMQPDVVHFLSETVVWLGLTVPVLRRYGLVTTLHDISYHPGDHESRQVPRWFAEYVVARSDRIIVHGDSLRQEAARTFALARHRIAVLPHIALQRYRTIAEMNHLRPVQDGLVRILFFGRIYAYKGVDVLIRSIPTVTEHVANIRVVIAGAGGDMDTYRQLIVDPAVFEIRNAHIDDLTTAQLFTDADVVVLPYVEASQSGVLAIANAFGKPVIVTNVGELGHTVTDGVSGLVIPAGDEKALAQAILRLATDTALRQRLGKAARTAMEAAASPAVIAQSALALYRDVARARDAHP
jgi:glycosyltransferase involved in cell wall biosynthesis